MLSLATFTAVLALTVSPAVQARAPKRLAPPHNVILVVINGLRGKIVTPESAPMLARLRDTGTYFPNSHSVFPTFTTANASALATGHQLGDTGNFSNTIWTVVQQDYFVDVANRVALPAFRKRHQPFATVCWSRDPAAIEQLPSCQETMP